MTERTSPGDAPSPATTTDPLAQTQPNEESTDTGSSSSGARPLDREDPERIGRYRLVHRIGEGGMGLVYLAHDDQLDRPVAVKVLRPGGDGDPRRLLREARSMARLSHPHIAAVYDVGTHDGDVYVAMEFVEGVNLRQWHEQASRSWKARCDMLLQAARGLVAAHAVGVVHRDFKPDNVIVGNDGRVRVLDFGLAKLGPRTALRQQDTTETMLGSIAGTPRYMAPEQLRGKPVGPAADQFALCVTAYELAYDQRPFPGEVFADVAAAVLTRPPASPPESTDVPDAVWPLLRQGMQLAQDERHTDVAAFVALLEDIAGAEPIPAVVSLPALRDAREQARDQMTSAYADDLIDADELDHRLEDLEDATDLGTVAALIADLAPVPEPVALVPAAVEPQVIDGGVSGPPAVIDVPEKSSTVAIFSGSRRGGGWVPARQNRIFSIFGGTEIDLRDVRLPPGEIEINVLGMFSGVELVVPPGTRVRLECSAVFGSTEQQESTVAPDPDSTVIRVTGFVMFGSVEIVERYPGESGWAARRRRKADRKRLRAEAKAKALPPKR